MKRFGKVMIFLLLCALFSHMAMAEGYIDIYGDRWVVIPEIKVPLNIDGRLNEGVWENAANLKDFVSIYHGEPAEAPTSVKLLYDEKNIYIGLICKYPKAGGPQSAEGVDVIISPAAHGQAYHHFSLGISNNHNVIATALEPGKSSYGNAVTKIYQGSDSWYAEIALPFTIFGEEGISPGDEWRINVVRDRVNYVPITSWLLIRQSKDAAAPGGGVKVSNGKRLVDEGRLGTIRFGEELEGELWYPGDPLLQYKGYTQKAFSFALADTENGDFDVELWWRNPSGKRTAIEEFKVSKASNRILIDFTHPRPYEKGFYGLDILIGQGDEKRVAHFSFDDDAIIEGGMEAQAHLTGVPQGKKRVTPSAASTQVEKLLEIIPDRTGFIFCGLPDNPELRPYQLFTWSQSDPWKIKSTHSPLAYPNDEYPQDKVLRVRNPLGQIVEYPYYQAPNGQRYFLDAHLWYKQRDHVVDDVKRVAGSDPLGAARILYRFAQVYPGYCPVFDHPTLGQYPVQDIGPPYPYWGGLWHRWFYGDLQRVASLAEAFSLVKETDAFQVLSQEVGEDVEYKVEHGMIRPSVDFVRTYPIYNGNMDPSIWRGLAGTGKALNEPDYIHETVERVKNFVESQFFFDGFWKEVTISYHRQSAGGLSETLKLLYGWSDPEGYISPRTGMRFDKLNMEEDFPIIKKALEVPRYLAYPDGRYLPIQDTWAYESVGNPVSGSILMPAARIARLSRGAGRYQSQVYLTFVPKYGHNHYDPLNLVLYAEGQELLPDLGYTHTNYRYWSISTLAHNTVVVDSKNMSFAGRGTLGGDIQVFAPVDDTVQVMQASQESAYPGVSEYKREVWSIGISSKEGYVVDIFRVSGGSRHEYSLQGDANNYATYETDMRLEDYGPYLLPPGTNVVKPKSEYQTGSAGGHYYAYAYVQDVKRAGIEDGKFDLTFVTRDGSKAKLKITGFVESGNNQVFLGKAPSLRGTRVLRKDTNDLIDDFHMPKFVLRREGQGLRSTFVTVLEPYVDTFLKKGPTIDNIELLKPDKSNEGDVALAISWGNTKDFLLSSSTAREPLMVGDMVLEGKMGFIRTEKGKVKAMYLVGGTSLKIGDTHLVSEGPAQGKIVKVLRKEAGDEYDAFLTDTKVPQGMKGSYIIVSHPDGQTHGYEIKDIREEGIGSLVILTMDPGFALDSETTSSMKFFPFTQWRGEHIFRIENTSVK
jgi:hypothetical protein